MTPDQPAECGIAHIRCGCVDKGLAETSRSAEKVDHNRPTRFATAFAGLTRSHRIRRPLPAGLCPPRSEARSPFSGCGKGCCTALLKLFRILTVVLGFIRARPVYRKGLPTVGRVLVNVTLADLRRLRVGVCRTHMGGALRPVPDIGGWHLTCDEVLQHSATGKAFPRMQRTA